MPKCCSLGDMAPVPCAIQSYPTNRLANCHREIWGGSWPRRKLWPGQLPPHLCQRDFPRFTAARVSLQSVCQDAQDHRGSDREWLKSRCPGLPRQRETGCRKLATAGCDRLSQARGRWLRQAVASSRPLVAKSFSAASQANPAALGRAPICAPQSFDPPI